MLGSIELHFFQHVVVFYVTAFWHGRIFDRWCVGMTDEGQLHRISNEKIHQIRFHQISDRVNRALAITGSLVKLIKGTGYKKL